MFWGLHSTPGQGCGNFWEIRKPGCECKVLELGAKCRQGAVTRVAWDPPSLALRPPLNCACVTQSSEPSTDQEPWRQVRSWPQTLHTPCVCSLGRWGLGLCPLLGKYRSLVLAGSQSGVFSMTQGQVGLRGGKEAFSSQSHTSPACPWVSGP